MCNAHAVAFAFIEYEKCECHVLVSLTESSMNSTCNRIYSLSFMNKLSNSRSCSIVFFFLTVLFQEVYVVQDVCIGEWKFYDWSLTTKSASRTIHQKFNSSMFQWKKKDSHRITSQFITHNFSHEDSKGAPSKLPFLSTCHRNDFFFFWNFTYWTVWQFQANTNKTAKWQFFNIFAVE